MPNSSNPLSDVWTKGVRDILFYEKRKVEISLTPLASVLEKFNGQTFIDFPDWLDPQMGNGTSVNAANDLNWRDVA